MRNDLPYLQRCAAFCRTHGAPHFYRDWTALTLLEYLNFHAQQGTLAVITNAEKQELEIIGLGIAWQDDAAAVQARAATGSHNLFVWQPTKPAGDCLVIGHVFVASGRRPAASGKVLRELVRWLVGRFPNWAGLRLFTVRRQIGGGHRFSEHPVQMLGRILTTDGHGLTQMKGATV